MIKLHKLNIAEPYKKFQEYYYHALESSQRNIEAICISSYDKYKSEVNSRFVNLKYIRGNKWYFYSNYDSPKAQDFKNHSQIAGAFFWNQANIQIRLKGMIFFANKKDSDDHFNSRTIEKNSLAISSYQSKSISSYDEVKKNYLKSLNQIKSNPTKFNKRPAHWGGYYFVPNYFEFWEGNDNRLNKRKCFTYDRSKWISAFLQP